MHRAGEMETRSEVVQSPPAKVDHLQVGTPRDMEMPKDMGTPKVMALMPSEHPKPAPSPQGGLHPPQGPPSPAQPHWQRPHSGDKPDMVPQEAKGSPHAATEGPCRVN